MPKLRLSLLLSPILLVPASAFAQPKPPQSAPPQSAPPQNTMPQNTMPLREVALFSSGVGYFGRAGQISGETSFPLTVHAPQIADLLKSLVLFDPRGGIKPVTYSLQDYLSNRARETDLPLAAAATPGAILQAFQGAQIHLDKPSGAVEGRILSVSSRQVKIDDTFIEVEHLTLLTASGVQTVRLDDVTSFRLLDPNLDLKLRSTLEQKAAQLTSKLDDGARNITLHFAGSGAREVRAGYLLETPAWKTSYRLVLDAKKKPFLQGWAIVENTTDEDWKSVKLSLISGRPISFIQDLAAPVYVSRPIVAPLVLGSPRPQTFGEGFAAEGSKIVNEPVDESQLRNRVTSLEARNLPSAAPQSQVFMNSGGRAALRGAGRGGNFNANAAGFKAALPDGIAQQSIEQSQLSTNGARSEAQGAERGELFEYAIDGATSVPHGEAAMVPIVSTDIEGQAVTIAQSPLNPGELPTSNGFSLRNSSGLHLQGGPITVFSGGIYAGDALVSNLSPKDGRLIAYARDLEVVAIQNEPVNQSNIVELSLLDGVLQITRNDSRARSWNFKNKSAALKTVVLEVPDEGGWKLEDAKILDEKTAGAQRFRFGIKPGDTLYKAKWVTKNEETLALFDAQINEIQVYIAQGAISPALKAKLSDIIAQKRRIADFAAQRALQEASLKDIEADQTRIRGNMGPLTSNSALFKTYEAKLGAQETRVEQVRAEIVRLREAEAAARTALRAALRVSIDAPTNRVAAANSTPNGIAVTDFKGGFGF